MENKLTRRSFLGFFLISGLISTITKKLKTNPQEKKAMFWRPKNEA